MSRRFKVKSLAGAVALSFMAAGAHAGTISAEFSSVLGNPQKYRNVTTYDTAPVPGNSGTTSAAAGAFYLVDEDNILGNGKMESFIAFCVDIFNNLSIPSKYTVTNDPFSGVATAGPGTFSAGQKSRVQTLFDNAYAGLDFTSSNQVAGFQVALWESLFEDSGSYDVKSGDFTVSWGATHGATTAANGFLTAGDDGQTNYNLTWLESESGGQNLVTVAPVPLPAAGFLFLGALGGLAALRRRKKAS